MIYKKKNTLCPVHNSKYFSWEGKKGVTEASTLCVGNPAGQIWPDACDYGFWITSARTLIDKLFWYDREDRTPDGELAGTWFKSEDDIQILVIND